ncbi:hypothetical protein QTP88_009598 [Uroleucon formosanum]
MDFSSDEELLVIACIANKEEKREKKRLWVHNINLKREEHGEFHTLFPDLLQDEANFFKYFRMSSEKFFELLNMLPQLQKQDTYFRRCIPSDERLAITLRLLGYGDSFATISFILQPIYMPQPTVEQFQRVKENFWRIWNYPNCIGALDGKHCVIEKPKNTGSVYFNYKKEISIVLLELVDTDYKFITVDIGAYGRNSDGGIFRSSSLGQALANGTLNIPTPKSLPLSDVIVPHFPSLKIQ